MLRGFSGKSTLGGRRSTEKLSAGLSDDVFLLFLVLLVGSKRHDCGTLQGSFSRMGDSCRPLLGLHL